MTSFSKWSNYKCYWRRISSSSRLYGSGFRRSHYHAFPNCSCNIHSINLQLICKITSSFVIFLWRKVIIRIPFVRLHELCHKSQTILIQYVGSYILLKVIKILYNIGNYWCMCLLRRHWYVNGQKCRQHDLFASAVSCFTLSNWQRHSWFCQFIYTVVLNYLCRINVTNKQHKFVQHTYNVTNKQHKFVQHP